MRISSPTRLLSVAAWLVALMLAGCGSSSWKAPLEHRGAEPRSGHARVDKPVLRSSHYKVRRGDTLYAIAWRSGVDFRSLARWNNIRPPFVIYPGQVLRLKSKSKPTSGTAPARVAKVPADTATNKATPARPIPRKEPPVRPNPRKEPPVRQAGGKRLHWSWPAEGPLLTGFSASDPARKGIKIGGSQGQPVRAAESGQVVYSGSGLIGYGRLIIIKHNETYLSAYAHNEKLLVREGDKVVKGKQIAAMGRSNDGKPMLHFEIRREGKPVNPLALLPKQK